MIKPDDATILLKDKGFWATLCMIYEALSSDVAQGIVSQLIKADKPIQSTKLLKKLDVNENQFHPIRKKLVEYCIIEKIIESDRTVYYNITPFAKNILNLSIPLLERIKKEHKKNVIPILNR